MSDASSTTEPHGWSHRLRTRVQAYSPDWLVKNGTKVFTALQLGGASLLVWDGGLSNIWQQVAANAVEMAGTITGLFVKEKPPTEEEQARLDAMSAPRYTMERIKQAFQPGSHIRQTLGFAAIVSGILTIASAFNPNMAAAKRNGTMSYGAFLTTAGATLQFSNNAEKGWKRFGAIMMINFASGIKRAADDFKTKGWKVAAAMGSFQASNLVAFFYPGATKPEAVAITPASAEITVTPSPSARLIAETAMGSPTQAEHMGWLKEAGISPQDFAETCAGFAHGANYITQKFGAPSPLIIIDDELGAAGKNWVHYDPEKQVIHLSRKTIETIIQRKQYSQAHTRPFVLGQADAAAMYGVEEAYHHYQTHYHPEAKILLAAETHRPDGRYDENNLVEKDAHRVVRQALVDLSMLNNPIDLKEATPDDVEWYRLQKRGAETQHIPEILQSSKFLSTGDYRQQRLAAKKEMEKQGLTLV